jgi:hypothetical protein
MWRTQPTTDISRITKLACDPSGCLNLAGRNTFSGGKRHIRMSSKSDADLRQAHRRPRAVFRWYVLSTT